ncbi:MAG: hypothetical protein J6D03_10575 [Clostridia bacterium]|nr:hypothetical protein [Clostridia bacterium]
MTNKHAIFVVVYKHRHSDLLSNLKNIDSKFDIYITTQQNDPNIDEYNQYATKSNIYIIAPDVTNIFAKREYIRKFAIDNGYAGYFMFDDDIRYAAWSIRNSKKRETSSTYPFYKCDFNEMLNAMVDASVEHNAAYTCNIRWGYIGWRKPNEVHHNAYINVANFGYFNTEAMKQVSYDLSGTINEDTDIIVKLLQKGLLCISVCDYMFDNIDKNAKNTTIDNGENLVVGQALKYHLPLYVNKVGRIQARIKFSKFWNTTELPEIQDQTLYELCKTRDVEKIRQYLINQNMVRKSNKRIKDDDKQ